MFLSNGILLQSEEHDEISIETKASNAISDPNWRNHNNVET